MLTIHQLQVFVTVAEHASVRQAAQTLVVSQPAVSASLAALEKAVGVELVRRAGRGIELTDAGRTLERYARVLLGLVDEAVTAARSACDSCDAPVRVGAGTAAADHMLMPHLARLQQRRAGLRFSLEVANGARIWQLLADRVIDIAVATRPPLAGAFRSLATYPNEFVLVAKPGLAWPGRLGELTWLVREEGSGTRAAAEEVMALLSVSPPLITIRSNAAIRSSAEAGLGVALLPVEAVRDAVATRALTLVHTEATPLRRPWHLVVRSSEQLPSNARQFVDDLVGLGGAFVWEPGVPAGAGPGLR